MRIDPVHTSSMAITYKSKVNILFPAALVVTYGLAAFVCITVIRTGGLIWLPLPLFVVAVAVAGTWMLFGTEYRIDAHALYAKCGPFGWRIPLRNIQHVDSDPGIVSNILVVAQSCSSCAMLSFDRVRIDYGDGRSLNISPADKRRFLADLAVARRPGWESPTSNQAAAPR